MLYLHLPFGSSESVRGGTFGFVLKNEFAWNDPAVQHGTEPNPDHANTSFNLMDLKLGLSGRFRSLALGGMTALGDSPLNK